MQVLRISTKKRTAMSLTAPDDLGAVREALEAAGVPLLEAQGCHDPADNC